VSTVIKQKDGTLYSLTLRFSSYGQADNKKVLRSIRIDSANEDERETFEMIVNEIWSSGIL
jgi:hypothetical protein